jgi:hypothetical protein
VALTYAVVWREPGGSVFAGKLGFASDSLRLEGSSDAGSLAHLRVLYRDLSGVRVGRSPEERIDGRPCIILERRAGRSLSIVPVGGAGALFEIEEALAELVSDKNASHGRAMIIVPIKPEKAPLVRELLARGPPFDPATTSLERHDVYVTDWEVIFLFEGPDVHALARELVRSPTAWRAAAAWEDCLAGRPVAPDQAYSWLRRPSSGLPSP